VSISRGRAWIAHSRWRRRGSIPTS